MEIVQAFDRWAKSSRLDPETVRAYRLRGRILARFGITRLAQLTRAEFSRFQDLRLETARAGTANNDLKAVRNLLRWLVRRGELADGADRVLDGLRVRSDPDPVPDYWPAVEVPRLLEIALELAPWFGIAFGLACLTGARRTELRYSHREDWDESERVVRLTRHTKRRKVRVIPLCAPALELVRLAPRSGPMFPPLLKTARTAYVSDDTFERAMARLEKASGIPCTWHKARRTFTVRAIRCGIPATEVARMLGHSSLSILYRHYYAWLQAYDPMIERLALQSAPTALRA